MSGRIWPGSLCWIVASEFLENVGRVVVAESLEELLRPITPPPNTTETDDTAPCELSPREIVGV